MITNVFIWITILFSTLEQCQGKSCSTVNMCALGSVFIFIYILIFVILLEHKTSETRHDT